MPAADALPTSKASPASKASRSSRTAGIREWWSGSLTVRIMAITGAITALIVAVTWVYLSTAVGNDLFENRRDEVLIDAAQATQTAQRLLDASDASDRAGLTSLMVATRATIRDTSSSSQVQVRRQLGQPLYAEAPLDFTTDAGLSSVVTPELADSVSEGAQPQYWQSVTFEDASGNAQPGIVVGSTLIFPGSAGRYSLFIGYSLAEAEQTLAFMQRILFITSIVLMVVIGILVFTAVRFVFRPIRVAADTSHRLAQGEDEVRMPPLGDAQFDVLANSFNEMADSLERRIDELDSLSTMQQRFVSDVSHELRTPLTTLRLAGDVLFSERESFTPATARSAELLHAQILRFEALLEDLLEISRYDAGIVAPALEATDLAALVADVVEGMQSLGESPISVHPLTAATTVEVDSRRIRRVITNLLGNAIEHGEGKPIDVTIDADADADADAASVTVTVADQGIGMTPEELEHVFERFWRADTSRARVIGGTGLGLAISLEDAQLHNGTLTVTAKPGGGATFVLTLPRAQAVSPATSAAGTDAERGDQR